MSLCQAEEIQTNELTTKQQSSTHADFYRRKKEIIQRKSKQSGDDCGLISKDSHISANGNFERCIYPTVDANDYAWTRIFPNTTADLRGSNFNIPSPII